MDAQLLQFEDFMNSIIIPKIEREFSDNIYYLEAKKKNQFKIEKSFLNLHRFTLFLGPLRLYGIDDMLSLFSMSISDILDSIFKKLINDFNYVSLDLFSDIKWRFEALGYSQSYVKRNQNLTSTSPHIYKNGDVYLTPYFYSYPDNEVITYLRRFENYHSLYYGILETGYESSKITFIDGPLANGSLYDFEQNIVSTDILYTSAIYDQMIEELTLLKVTNK